MVKNQEIESRTRKLSLEKPVVMGILNLTPDSFSDGGFYMDHQLALEKALEMIAEGADIVDLGGESSGPGSRDVSFEKEAERVIPFLQKLRKHTEAWISVDTWKSEIARLAIENGADMVNDVTALRGDVAMSSVIADSNVPCVLMYSKDSTARTTVFAQNYVDVVQTVSDFFMKRLDAVSKAGILKKQCILDPGMGAFISTIPAYSLKILKQLETFKDFGLPLLIGPSRKSFIGKILDVKISDRLEGSLAACALGVWNGASIFRVHDVQSTRRVVDMVHAIQNS